jgi:hypothetical protein
MAQWCPVRYEAITATRDDDGCFWAAWVEALQHSVVAVEHLSG